MTTNVLQPLNINGSDPNFFNNFCGACLNVTNADGNLRGQATQFIEQTKRQEGCIPAVLQIATDSEVNKNFQGQVSQQAAVYLKNLVNENWDCEQKETNTFGFNNKENLGSQNAA
jgi:hypothetical protein